MTDDRQAMEHKVDLVTNLIKSLEESYAKHAEAQRIARLGHWTCDLVNNQLQWSYEIYRIFAIDPEQFSGSYEAFLDFVHPEDRNIVNHRYMESLKSKKPYDIEHRLLLLDNSIKWVHERCETVFAEDGTPLCSTGTVQDITQRKQAELIIQHMAHYDQLTGLANRFMFFDRLKQELMRASRNMNKMAVLFLDLDGFKKVNDSRSHEAGDILLKHAAERLQSCLREMDTVARIGGDEFAIILAKINHTQDASMVAEKIIHSLGQPFLILEEEMHIGVSIGIAIYPEHGDHSDTLLSCADSAMYQVKKSGKNNYKFHTHPANPANEDYHIPVES